MKGSVIRITKDRSDYGVAYEDGVADVWATIVTITVPAGLAYVLLNHAPIVFKAYDTSSDEITTRDGGLILGFKGAGDTLVKELYRFPYSTFLDLSVANQKNRNYREMVSLNMPFDYVIAKEDEELIVQFKSDTIWDASNVDSLIEFDLQKVILA